MLYLIDISVVMLIIYLILSLFKLLIDELTSNLMY